MPDDAVTRDTLFPALREQWQRTEDAIAAVERRFDEPAHDGWSVGDVFRHLTSTAHDTAANVRAMLAAGGLSFDVDAVNAAGVERLRALDAKMLRIELNTAHGVVWMYVQRFSDEDLARTYSLWGNEVPLGLELAFLAGHEREHVAAALAAAGVPESAVVPVETAHRWA